MTLQLVLIVVLGLGALFKAVEVVRAPRDRHLSGSLAACLALLAVGQVISLPPLTAVLNDAVAGSGKFVYNAATAAGLYLLLCFFSWAVRGPAAGRRRVLLDGALVVAVLVVLAVLLAATPLPFRNHTVSSPFLTRPTVAWFYVVGGAYFVYAYLACATSTWRYARRCRGGLAVALRVVVLGLAGLTVASLVRAGWVLVRYLGGPPLEWVNAINFPLNNASFIVLALGLVLLGVLQVLAYVRAALADRRDHRRLAPLWTLLAQTYPDVVLPPRGVARGQSFQRRVVECRDGLARLRPAVAAVAGDRDLDAASPAELAAVIRAATALDLPPGGAEAPAGGVIDTDVPRLVAISTALSATAPAVSRS